MQMEVLGAIFEIRTILVARTQMILD